jgi:hypothetical protein
MDDRLRRALRFASEGELIQELKDRYAGSTEFLVSKEIGGGVVKLTGVTTEHLQLDIQHTTPAWSQRYYTIEAPMLSELFKACVFLWPVVERLMQNEIQTD